MSEISSSIKITDEFSEPLKELAKASFQAEDAISSVSVSLVEQAKVIKGIAEQGKDLVYDIKDSLVPAYDQFKNSITGVGTAFKNMSENMDVDSFKELAVAFVDATKASVELGKETGNVILQVLKLRVAILDLPFTVLYKTAMGAFNKLKESTINLAKSLKSSIEQSLDEITIAEKMEAMWGEAGRVAKRRAYELANQIGESATMVTELAGKAAYEGIGTEQFERMMLLADKVSKLKPGETVESAASTLMSDLKSGHSAGTIAQMFGGGQVMERQLRNAGYERALNRGDVDEALKIAEKIAEKSGLTKENYNDAFGNMSQNFKRIFNVIDNVKKRLGETFNRSFAPTVEKVKEFVTSEKFQTVVNIFDKIISKVGELANFFTEGIIDNIEVMGVLLAVAGVAKMALIFRMVTRIVKASKLLLAITKLFRGPISMIITGLVNMIRYLVSIGVKQSIIYLKAKAMAALKIAGPYLLVGVAIAAALKLLHVFFGEGKTFTEFLMGGIAAAYQLALNAFMNVLIFFNRMVDEVHIVFLEAKKTALGVKQAFMQNIGQLLQWMVGAVQRFIDESGLGAILSALGIDIGGIASSASDWISDLGKEETEALAEISKQIESIRTNELEYIDIMQGVKEAWISNGETVKNFLKNLLFSNKDQEKNQKGIAGNTDKIRQYNEQEEELRWLKAFSDRQIMSAYTMSTSNSNVYNFNGMSQRAVDIQAGKHNITALPGRRLKTASY